MPIPTIYYIRHGETAWNAAGRFQGSQDIPLNDLGREQAAHAGDILADLLARDARPASRLGFVSSPLGRARSTMALLRSALKLPPDGYAVDDRLREIGYGHWEGATAIQQEASHPEIFAARQIDKWSLPPPNGESYASVQLRMHDWVESLTGDTVAVAHGGTARALMVALGVATPAEVWDLPIGQGVVYVFSDSGMAKIG